MAWDLEGVGIVVAPVAQAHAWRMVVWTVRAEPHRTGRKQEVMGTVPVVGLCAGRR
eukprot:CAMPEP_0202398890 /NCGR_PEP_ID=MMETSP1128-20130828/1622_1 /ASSEMBLY_ACC=CAM_ASM_000463 /TAXON_ID=3047 /ORGANISM="Dunaliella tertiolecta, Strain CCMP1320" /LENGTH=55 /DNA_ID=CAMNT_0049002095 /DNA_START=779 /DNA_END=946 /DNA_ORIENTATION=+